MLSVKEIIKSNDWTIESIKENYRGMLALIATNKVTGKRFTTDWKSKRYVDELLYEKNKKHYNEMDIYMN